MWLRILILSSLILTIYFLGQSHCQNSFVAQKVEIIKNVNNKNLQILSTPNASKSDLLKLMYANKL